MGPVCLNGVENKGVPCVDVHNFIRVGSVIAAGCHFRETLLYAFGDMNKEKLSKTL